MVVEAHVKIMGLLMLTLAAANALLPGRLRWREELKRLSPLNRQVFVMHAVFVVLITTLQYVFAALCAYFAAVCAWALVCQRGGLR
jgi:hypothetical protein